jgi:small subunit ribosomal protein S18
MARNDRDRKRVVKDANRRGGKKKVCFFCQERIDWVDYKDVNLLRRFMSDRGKIRARRVSGNCSQHQRDVAVAIKTARELALLPYTQRSVNERGPGGRGGRASRDGRGGYPAAAPVAPDGEAGGEDVEVDVDVIDEDADVEDAT